MDEDVLEELLPSAAHGEFGKQFLGEFLKDGFGAATKRHLELYVFYLLEQLGELNKLDNNRASEVLRITESKVRSYRYESKLRFSSVSEDEFKQHILWMLARSDFDVDSRRIKLVIEDTLIRKRLSAVSKRLGGVPDTSFNSEIVSLPYDQLSFLVKWLFGEATAKLYCKQFELLLKEDSKLKFAEIRKAIVLGAAKGLGGSALRLAKTWFTGDPT